MIKTIIFDAFGTLIDTKDGSVRATEAILKKNGCNLDPKAVYGEWKKYYGEYTRGLSEFLKEDKIFLMGLERIYSRFGINGDAKKDVDIMLQSRYERDAFPETAAVIEKLRNKYKVYIGSNTDDEPLFFNLKRNNIKVDGCFTSEELQKYKPNRDFFEKILMKLNYSSNEVVYVGDSQVDDILGAKSLDISVVWINRKKQILKENIPKPDYEISNLSEIFNFL